MAVAFFGAIAITARSIASVWIRRLDFRRQDTPTASLATASVASSQPSMRSRSRSSASRKLNAFRRGCRRRQVAVDCPRLTGHPRAG